MMNRVLVVPLVIRRDGQDATDAAPEVIGKARCEEGAVPAVMENNEGANQQAGADYNQRNGQPP
jgi:hypothetical protein